MSQAIEETKERMINLVNGSGSEAYLKLTKALIVAMPELIKHAPIEYQEALHKIASGEG